MAEAPKAPGGHPVYFDGRMCPPDTARLSIEDHGALYGLGFFETFRTSGGRPHLWEWHRRRLLRACAVAGIELPPSFLASAESRLREIVHAQLDAHALEDGVFRYTVTAGSPSHESEYTRYASPGEWLSVRPLPCEPGAEGITLRVLATRRDNGEWLPRPKSLNFANALLGIAELRRRGAGPDEEGLFLARDGGHVVEAVRHNVAWISGGEWHYPDPELGAVAGTCLDWLLDHGFTPTPIRARLDDVLRADAVVVLNSVRGITPVRAVADVDDRALLASWRSHAHPQVIDLRGRWSAALRESANRGTLSPSV